MRRECVHGVTEREAPVRPPRVCSALSGELHERGPSLRCDRQDGSRLGLRVPHADGASGTDRTGLGRRTPPRRRPYRGGRDSPEGRTHADRVPVGGVRCAERRRAEARRQRAADTDPRQQARSVNRSRRSVLGDLAAGPFPDANLLLFHGRQPALFDSGFARSRSSAAEVAVQGLGQDGLP